MDSMDGSSDSVDSNSIDHVQQNRLVWNCHSGQLTAVVTLLIHSQLSSDVDTSMSSLHLQRYTKIIQYCTIFCHYILELHNTIYLILGKPVLYKMMIDPQIILHHHIPSHLILHLQISCNHRHIHSLYTVLQNSLHRHILHPVIPFRLTQHHHMLFRQLTSRTRYIIIIIYNHT